MKITDWKLINKEKNIDVRAEVPGDITADLLNAGLIDDPYFGLNKEKIKWVGKTDFDYVARFDLDKDVLSKEDVVLTFKGIDLFSEIRLNGKLLGKTENMFLEYSYSVKDIVKEKGNELIVAMKSTLNYMKNIDTRGFFGTFNVERLFIRKAQCHFGWDWAPDLGSYGIWNDVTIDGLSKDRIDNVYVVARNCGDVTLFVENNYNVRHLIDFQGHIVDKDKVIHDDALRYSVSSEPNGVPDVVFEAKVTGKKNFANLKVAKPQLWYPVGYGDHPLYNYKVELLRDGKVISAKSGTFALREIELEELPKSADTIGYTIKINGEEVFVRGSNWVPCECFTGTVKTEKYEKLVSLAKAANCNMLRVWGGGIYEKDEFYDICDREGIMVWQDFMLACGDIPDDDEKWLKNMIAESEYQLKRLRNHASIVYWCGGNEKTGSYGLQISHGDYFIDYVLRGIVANFDTTRPYARQSPCSLSDVGNDLRSGESHYCSNEPLLESGIDSYRDKIAAHKVPFISECALMGPNTLETNEKIYPKDKLWPLNEYWDARLMDNPYSSVSMPFYKRQLWYTSHAYGENKNIRDFIAKGMLFHAESLRAECEFARSNREITSGFMNWMFSDIWPSGSWAVIDYYLEPKQVMYQMRKSYAPLLVTFVRDGNGKTQFVIVNDTPKDVDLKVTFGAKTIDGKIIGQKEISVNVKKATAYKAVIDDDRIKSGTYLFAYYDGDAHGENLYSDDFWRNCKFESDYDYKIEKIDDHTAKITVKANKFAKQVFVSAKDNFRYLYSDNYFDVEAGREKTITVTSKDVIDENAFTITDFAKETA